jgi:hypothetical protein
MATYWIWTILTSVGYGSYSQLRNREMWFAIYVELLQIGVASAFVYILSLLVKKMDNSYDSKMR